MRLEHALKEYRKEKTNPHEILNTQIQRIYLFLSSYEIAKDTEIVFIAHS